MGTPPHDPPMWTLPHTPMKRAQFRTLLPLSWLALATVSMPALAQPSGSAKASTAAVSSEDQTKAQKHFQRAKELYEAGNYREAVPELEAAHRLEPKAKNLVMNLGIVHEKLAHFDEALAYFKTYLEMEDVTPDERTKAEGIIKRIEGAKRAQATHPPASSSSKTTAPTPTQRPLAAEPPQRGRVDALTIGFGSVAALGLVAGAGLGIYALASKPSDFVTGRDGTYQELEDKNDGAHTIAVVADVSLGVGVVAAAVAAGLYFGRTKDSTTATSKTPRVSAAPLPSGGAVFVGGTF